MKASDKKNVAGFSFGGGRKENFFFCLLEYYPDKERWFLSSLKQVKDEELGARNDIITKWIEDYGLDKVIVDFPQSLPPCETCTLDCPGEAQCHNEVVLGVRSEMQSLLAQDKNFSQNKPKEYERERVSADKVDYSRDIMAKGTTDPILSKSFKRKIKKGFIPYWNRPIDAYIWFRYYDQMLSLFKVSYDSFGNTSVMLRYRFNYLLRHLPRNLILFESNTYICLLELLRANVITRKHIQDLGDIELAAFARVRTVRDIEKKLNLFIYENDVEILGKNPKAFDSFLLSLAGQKLLLDHVHQVPKWGQSQSANFVFPIF